MLAAIRLTVIFTLLSQSLALKHLDIESKPNNHRKLKFVHFLKHIHDPGHIAALPQSDRAVNYSRYDVGAIKARGFEGEGRMPTATKYILSEPAALFDLTPQNSLLDGGGAELPLFNESTLPPGELPGDAGAQFIQQNDPSDFCAEGDQAGYSILNVSMPTLVTFAVPKEQANRKDASVVVAPGGGGRFLSWSKEGTRIAKWLNSIGITAYVLKYRVPANSKETEQKQLIDAQRAITVVRAHLEAFPWLGLNSSRIGFMGFSQGAFITGKVATTKFRAYAPVDKMDNVSHLPDFALELYGYGPLEGGTAEAPPTFIAIAENDPCVSPEMAMQYYQNLQNERQSNGRIHELHVFSDGHHGYGDCSLYVDGDMWEPVCAWTVNAEAFMERVIGIEKPLAHRPMVEPDLSSNATSSSGNTLAQMMSAFQAFSK